MNQIILIGNTTKEVETSQTTSGKAFARFSLAVQRPYSKEETDFFNVICFDKQAEVVGKYLDKGRKVAVSGYVQIRKWQKQDGSNQQSIEVVADKIEFLSKSERAEQEPKQLEEDTSAGESDLPF